MSAGRVGFNVGARLEDREDREDREGRDGLVVLTRRRDDGGFVCRAAGTVRGRDTGRFDRGVMPYTSRKTCDLGGASG